VLRATPLHHDVEYLARHRGIDLVKLRAMANDVDRLNRDSKLDPATHLYVMRSDGIALVWKKEQDGRVVVQSALRDARG
jgi:hypothetical protein